MSYYKYKPREVENAVDWSDISGKISKVLDEKRDKILKTTQEVDNEFQLLQQKLSKPDVGDNMSLNRFYAGVSDFYQGANLQLHRKLQNGEIKLNEYRYLFNNLESSGNDFLETATALNAYDSEIRQRQADGVGHSVEPFIASVLEQFANVAEMTPYLDPNTFSIGITGLAYDPKTGGYTATDDKSKAMSFSYLKGMMGQRQNKFNVEGELDNVTKTFGKDIRVMMGQYGYKTISDARQKNVDSATQQVVGTFDKAKENHISSMMENRFKSAQVLTDMVGVAPNGKPYAYTLDADEAEKDESKILMVPDPVNTSSGRFVPYLGKKQSEVVRQRLSDEIDGRLDYSEQYTQLRAVSGGGGGRTRTDAERRGDQIIQNMAYLYGGDDEQVKTAMQFFEGANPDIEKISKRTGGGAIEVYYKGEKNPRIIELGASQFTQAFDRGSALYQGIKGYAFTPGVVGAYNEKTRFLGRQNDIDLGAPQMQVEVNSASTIDMTPKDEKGKQTKTGLLVGVAASAPSYLTASSDDELASQTVDYYGRAVDGFFKNDDDKEGMIIRARLAKDYKGVNDDFVEIFLPKFMTAPVIVPMTNRVSGQDNWRENVGQIMEGIMTQIENGNTSIAPEDLEPLFMDKDDNGNDAFDAFNNETFRINVNPNYKNLRQSVYGIAAPAATTDDTTGATPAGGLDLDPDKKP